MKTFRELTIYSNKQMLSVVIEYIERRSGGDWSINREIVENDPVIGDDMICFSFAGSETIPSANLWLATDQNRLYVANIVPHEKMQLSYDEYNSLIEEFTERFVIPLADEMSVTFELSSNEFKLQDVLSDDTFQKLRKFSAAANKSTGSHHPADRRRWLDFIASLHLEQADLHASFLRRWLEEEEDWPPDTAADLVSEYEFGLELLDLFDEYH